jgi:hypothetical protein
VSQEISARGRGGRGIGIDDQHGTHDC